MYILIIIELLNMATNSSLLTYEELNYDDLNIKYFIAGVILWVGAVAGIFNPSPIIFGLSYVFLFLTSIGFIILITPSKIYRLATNVSIVDKIYNINMLMMLRVVKFIFYVTKYDKNLNSDDDKQVV